MQQNTRNQFIDLQIQAAAVLANDEKALEALYTNNFYKTEAFVMANSGTAEEAKDIYQEAFIAVWQNIKAGRFVPQNGSSLEAYLFQIAKYKWYDYLRAAKKISVVPVEDSSFIEASYNEEEENYIENVRHHFKNLGEPCRKVLTLFYFMKQSMSNIAATFSWTEATAKNNKYRCLQRLRNMVVGKQ
ncbi:MAG: RNA polymerase sigma factor [Chitinophagaceae bacterium]|nr:RNA polymerase sigma factor [Chitinophagaceae bacterium]